VSEDLLPQSKRT